MAARVLATVFHQRSTLRRKFLEEVGWQAQDLEDFYQNLQAESFQPESLLLDLLLNSFSSAPEMLQRRPIWWRERARAIPRQLWYQNLLSFALSPALANDEVVFVDFWEQELANDDLCEALALHCDLARSGRKLNIVWLCWSASLLENWQQEGASVAALKEDRLVELIYALGFEPILVPVTDPLGALIGARRLVQGVGAPASTARLPLLVLPAIGNDKLVRANWYMKTKARFSEAMGQGLKEVDA